MPGDRWARLSRELGASQAAAKAVEHCGRYGHGWPPLRKANPGDRHWCHHCGTRRVISADGTVTYERPAE